MSREARGSVVYKDAHAPIPQHVLDLKWSFGLNRQQPGSVYSLTDTSRKCVFYTSSNTGIVLDYQNSRQHLLQGHSNRISATAVSADRRWLLTADKGDNSMVIIWDTLPHLDISMDSGNRPTTVTNNQNTSITTLPIKTLYQIHKGKGVIAASFTADSRILMTLGADSPQTVCLWDWTTESDEPLFEHVVQGPIQTCIRSNPEDVYEFCTTGPEFPQFFIWDHEYGIKQCTPSFNVKDFQHTHAPFTFTVFVPNSKEAISSTTHGDVIVWSDRTLTNLNVTLEMGQKSAIKILRLHNSAIHHMETVSSKYIVTGGEDGFVKIFDTQFRLLLWFEKLKAGAVSSISFNYTPDMHPMAKEASSRPGSGASDFTTAESIVADAQIPEFVIATSEGKILQLSKNNASGNAVGVAKVVSSKLAASADPKQKKTTQTDWVNVASVTGSNGALHQADIARPSSKEEGTKTTKVATKQEAAAIKIILETISDSVTGLLAHPHKDHYMISVGGTIQLWDYKARKLIASRTFQVLETPIVEAKKSKEKAAKNNDISIITAMNFSPSGKILGIGFENGSVRLVNPEDLSDHPEFLTTSNSPPQPPFPYNSSNMSIQAQISKHFCITISQYAITHVAFSEDEQYLAAADKGHGVMIVKRESVPGDKSTTNHGALVKANSPKKSALKSAEKTKTGSSAALPSVTGVSAESKPTKLPWVYCGRNQAHYKDIIALLFIPPPAEVDSLYPEPRLISVSQDRHCAEYDVKNASILGGFALKHLNRIEQTARPLAAIFHPKSKQDHSDLFLLTSNTEFKLKQYNARTRFCRRTALGPTYGGTLTKLMAIPSQFDQKYIAFATEKNIVGVLRIPLDGNPHRAMGLLAHPGDIGHIACTHDGQYMMTAGKDDHSIHMWSIHAEMVDAQLALSGDPLDAFLNIADETKAGKNGAFFQEMEDYFYYAQLRSQGEDAKASRKISETVPLKQVPFIMQALGFYPSEYEIENMMNEMKYSDVESSSGFVESINFADLLKLYVNHKPVKQYTMEDIQKALDCALSLDPNRKAVRFEPNKQQEGICTKDGFLSLVQLYGETLTAENVQECFQELCKEDIPSKFTTTQLIEDVLGFQSLTESLTTE